jgi:hypothetical protein
LLINVSVHSIFRDRQILFHKPKAALENAHNPLEIHLSQFPLFFLLLRWDKFVRTKDQIFFFILINSESPKIVPFWRHYFLSGIGFFNWNKISDSCFSSDYPSVTTTTKIKKNEKRWIWNGNSTHSERCFCFMKYICRSLM